MGISEAPSLKIPANVPVRFGVAFIATILALLIALPLNHFADSSAPYITTLAAVVFCAWYCGLGPSMASIALSLLTIDYWTIPPTHSLRIEHTADWFEFLAFLCAGILIAAIGESSRREREQLWDAAGELEEKVRERTGELDQANEGLRQLSGRLLNLQDEERRRIARELHDNAGQALAALAMNLGTVAKDLEHLMRTAATVADSASMVQQMSDDIRTMSYLLHPPLLDETGLAPTLQWYVEGFAERSKIAVELECSQDLGRLPREVETAVFRLVQECLTNIHRHAGSPTAAIRIERSGGRLRVEVRDNGKGISPEMREQMESGGTVGVGIRGMRERVRQLGGNLEITSDGIGTGTRIVVRLPATEAPRSQKTGNAIQDVQSSIEAPAAGGRQIGRAAAAGQSAFPTDSSQTPRSPLDTRTDSFGTGARPT
jgi:signal transduction histidine kinase